MKLIAELNEHVEYIVEETGGRKKLYLEGTFLQAGIKNRNGRIYPPTIMEREANRYIAEKISKGCAFGELGHPSTPQINMERISHIVTELKRDGNDYRGKARLIDEGYGRIARGIVEAEGQLGVSSRGMGSLKEDRTAGAMMVQPDFRLAVAADIVADPSAPGAWVNGVMEGVEWVQTPSGEWEQRVIDEIKRGIHSAPAAILEEKKVEMFETYVLALQENQMVRTLIGSGTVSESQAKRAIQAAKVKARLGGRQKDPLLIYTLARQFLGLNKSLGR